MIYTVTFNPALDYVVHTDGFVMGGTNRASSEQLLAGGKGINVSVVLNNLGTESVALGFTAGFTGAVIRNMTESQGCKCDFIELPCGFSRINVKLKTDNETEINGMGPDIPQESMALLMEKLDKLEPDDFLVLAGSIPRSLPDTVYRDIMERLSGKGVHFVVDAANKLLLNVLDLKPFLIKPNHIELGEIFGENLKGDKIKAAYYAEILKDRGARNVLVSMAEDGAVLAAEDGKVYFCDAPKGTAVNSVGAGDSMVAGFLTGWCSSHSFDEALKTGIAAGSASAFSAFLAEKDDVERLCRNIKISVK
ncbi:MAG: 1-phosphofructokinase [Oscillospiraceae bacterium]